MSIKDRSVDTLPNAVLAFEKAIELDPTMDEARLNVGSVFLDYLDYQRALEQFQAVRKRFPNHYQAMIGEANCLYGVGNYDEAMKLYLETLEMDAGASNGESILRVGKIYEQQLNKPKKALEYYKRYVSVVNPPKTAKIRQTIMFLEQAGKLQMQQTQQPQPGAPGAEPAQPQQGEPNAAPQPDSSEQGGSSDDESKNTQETQDEGQPPAPADG
jgi:tetratricopeptide (TPR) repeat protein